MGAARLPFFIQSGTGFNEEKSMRLKNKIAIVTGGGSGFGEGIASDSWRKDARSSSTT